MVRSDTNKKPKLKIPKPKTLRTSASAKVINEIVNKQSEHISQASMTSTGAMTNFKPNTTSIEAPEFISSIYSPGSVSMKNFERTVKVRPITAKARNTKSSLKTLMPTQPSLQDNNSDLDGIVDIRTAHSKKTQRPQQQRMMSAHGVKASLRTYVHAINHYKTGGF